jgi:glucokinase
METAGTNLGVGVVNLIHIFNPELIIIGGGVSKAGDLIFEPVRRTVAQRVMRDISVRITAPALGENPGLLGAVALVLENT